MKIKRTKFTKRITFKQFMWLNDLTLVVEEKYFGSEIKTFICHLQNNKTKFAKIYSDNHAKIVSVTEATEDLCIQAIIEKISSNKIFFENFFGNKIGRASCRERV